MITNTMKFNAESIVYTAGNLSGGHGPQRFVDTVHQNHLAQNHLALRTT